MSRLTLGLITYRLVPSYARALGEAVAWRSFLAAARSNLRSAARQFRDGRRS